MKNIDLNCDMGEFPEAVANGTQESLMPYLTSVNVACGGHAGNQQTMEATIRQAMRWKLAVGAHPGYPDRPNFGRVALTMTPEAIAVSVFEQVCALAGIADGCGVRLTHVKPHGALYNQAARDHTLAAAIARGVARWNHDVVLIGLAGSSMLELFRQSGFQVAAEAFADRRYEPDGSLRPRTFNDAVIVDPEEAATQALGIIHRQRVMTSDGTEIAMNAQTICIHSDTPGAADIAAAVVQTLRHAGIQPASLQ